MKKKIYVLWGLCFIICAGLGFMPDREGAADILLTCASILFFLPPAWLLHTGNGSDARLIRNLAALSLGLTLLLLVLNLRSAAASDAVGMYLHGLLAVISAPMLCSRWWALSLFLWACLLGGGLQKSKR